jgi:putative ABC transport system substrate-binding protein
MRVLVIALLTAGFLCGILAGCDSPPPRTEPYTIGILSPSSGHQRLVDSFIADMAGHEFRGDQKVRFEVIANNSPESIEADLQTLLAKDLDLLLAFTCPAAQKAAELAEGKKIPVLFFMYDAIGPGVVASRSAPGGNATGVQARGGIPKVLELFLKIAPRTDNLFVPLRFDTPAARTSLSDLREAAAALGIGITVAEVADAADLEERLAAIPDACDGIFLLHSILISQQTETIVEAAVRRKMPTISSTGQLANGIMITYGMNPARTGKQLGRIADLLLQGAAPGDIPVEVVDYSLGVNLKTAGAIGITIPDEVLRLADDIIR